MSQNPLVYSGTQYSKTSSLKPALAAALASLEVQLDRELARYRRTRSYRTSSQSNLGISTANNQLQYLNPANVDMHGDVTASAVEGNYSHTDAETLTAQNPDQIADRKIASEVKTPTPISELTSSPLPLPPPPPPQTLKFAAASVEEAATTPTTNSPLTTVSIVPAASKVTVESKHNTADSQTSKSQPDDYLESSEALLRSLTEEPPKKQKRPNNNDSLLSPLGIGSMLLLVVAASILGVVVINPKNLQFGQDSSSKVTNSTAENSQPSTDATAKNVVEPIQTPIPKYPNLAKDEFPEVNNPNDVVGLKPKSKSTPSIAPAPENNSVAIAPQQQVPVNPTPPPTITQPVTVAPSVSSSPTPRPEIPLSEIKLSADGFYHIVIDNNGQGTFAAARKVVPDAYLSPDGKLVYLGAIKDKRKATVLLKEIQARGINARIRQP